MCRIKFGWAGLDELTVLIGKQIYTKCHMDLKPNKSSIQKN